MTCRHPAYPRYWPTVTYQGSPCFSSYTVDPVCSDAKDSNAQVIDTHRRAHTDAAYEPDPCETLTGSENNGAQSELNMSKLEKEKGRRKRETQIAQRKADRRGRQRRKA